MFRYKKDVTWHASKEEGSPSIEPYKGKIYKMYATVLQFSRAGKFISRYSSVRDAAKGQGIDMGSIRNCINRVRRTAGGYQWRSPDDPLFKNGIVNIPPVGPVKNSYVKTVLQFDLEGNFVREYQSITAAYRETGIAVGTISACITGVAKSGAGFQWKVKNDPYFANGIKPIEPYKRHSTHAAKHILQFDAEGKLVKE
ncbi:MAG: hypothetical protein GY940_24660, partial [bacterium]|nr:hypothetical protein [bacterium]